MKNWVLFFFLLCFISCTFQPTTEKSRLTLISGESNYIINLDGKINKSLPISTIFKNVYPIILESDTNCLIGEIYDLQVFGNKIFIFDKFIANSLFVFDTNGQFVRKIGALGNGPGEYIQINDFTINPNDGSIYICDRGIKIHKYKQDGTFINTINLQISKSNVFFIHFYNDKIYASILSYAPNIDDFMLIEINPKNGEVLSSHFTYDNNKGWMAPYSTGHSFFISRLNDIPKFTNLFMDYIILLNDTIKPYIKLESKNLITKQDIDNLPENASVVEKIAELNKKSKIWDVHNYIENNNIISFKHKNGIKDDVTVFFFKETRETQLIYYFDNDLIFKNDSRNDWFSRFVFYDSSGAYSVLHSSLINNFIKSIENNEIVSDLRLLEQLSQLNEESNPVIFFYEF